MSVPVRTDAVDPVPGDVLAPDLTIEVSPDVVPDVAIDVSPDVAVLAPAGRGGVAVSTISQLGAQGLHLVLNIVSSLALIHYLGPDKYGNYVFVITTAAIIGLVSDLGLNKLGVRDIARDPADEDDVLGSVLLVRLALAVLAVGITLLALAAMGANAELLAAGAVISMLFFTEAALAVVIVFHVRIQQQYEAVVRVVIETVETALVLWLIHQQATLIQLLVAPVIAAVIGVVGALLLVRRRIGHFPALRATHARRLFIEALPIGLTLLVAAAYLKLPAVLLGSMTTSAEVGLYGAAYQPIEYLLLASAVVINVLLPLLARNFTHRRDHFVRIYQRGTEALLVLTIPIAAVLIVGGSTLVTAVYGADFAASADPLRILGIALIFMVQSFWQSMVLLAGGQQRITLLYNLVALAITVALCFALIPSLGQNGAALAILVTAVIVVVSANVATAASLGARPELGRVVWIVIVGIGVIGGAQALTVAGLASFAALGVTIVAGTVVLWRLHLLPDMGMLADERAASPT